MWNTMVTLAVAEEQRRDQLRAADEWRQLHISRAERQRSQWYGTLWNMLSLFPKSAALRPKLKRREGVGR